MIYEESLTTGTTSSERPKISLLCVARRSAVRALNIHNSLRYDLDGLVVYCEDVAVSALGL